MRLRVLIMLAILPLQLIGCVIWYEGHPAVTIPPQPLLPTEASLPFYVQMPQAPWHSPDPPDNSRAFFKAMAQVGFTPIIVAPDKVQEERKYCSVQLRVKVMNNPGVPGMLVLLIPTGGNVLYTLDYEIYENNARLQSYQYRFTQEGIIWGPLLAFVWVNWFNSTKQDAFVATLRRFIQDARRDGYL